jgi:hypothetical protein
MFRRSCAIGRSTALCTSLADEGNQGGFFLKSRLTWVENQLCFAPEVVHRIGLQETIRGGLFRSLKVRIGVNSVSHERRQP